MSVFNCLVGESLRIGDVARLHVRSIVREGEEDQVWLAIEWTENEKIPVEIVPPDDSGGSTAPRF
ncbi:MAG: hypothetical protein KFF45_04390 [Thioalkalivibrio sp.]|nr:hypothetical protein [Thioalkalivibrio sp.]